MATAKQLAWRKKFAKMAKAGTLRRNPRRHAKRKSVYGTADREPYPGTASARRRTRPESKREKRERRIKAAAKNPSPAQLRARRKFAAMAKARAKATRAKKHNPVYTVWGLKKSKKHPSLAVRGSRRKLGKVQAWTAWGARRKAKKAYKKYHTAVINPRGRHLPGLPAKYQRMYEHILATSGSKRIAAATVQKAVRRHNPGLFARLFGKKTAPVGARKTQRGRKRVAAVGYRRVQRGRKRTNPKWLDLSPRGSGSKAKRRAKDARAKETAYGRRYEKKYGHAESSPAFRRHFSSRDPRRFPNSPRGFNAFRGRPVKQVLKSFAANGTPRDVKECGGLVDMHLRGGKKVRFNPSRARLCYKGNRLHIVGARFRKPNPPGEVDYGEILRVCYRADKPHLEGDGRMRPYEHKFGEEGGVRPHLVVDAEGLPIISGGTYTIPTEGIRD